MEKGRVMIIYRATSPSSKVYIGQSVNCLAHRRSQHEAEARRGVDTAFCRAIRKYGAANFRWEILCRTTSIAALNFIEPRYIALYDADGAGGYNSRSGGLNGRQSEESRRKIAATLTGRKRPPEVVAKVAEKLRGRKKPPMSAEARANISAAKKGCKLPPVSLEARANLSAALSGRKLSESHKAKIGAAHRGKKHKPHSAETRTKMSAAHRGRKRGKMSDETRRKISASKKGIPWTAKRRAAQKGA